MAPCTVRYSVRNARQVLTHYPQGMRSRHNSRAYRHIRSAYECERAARIPGVSIRTQSILLNSAYQHVMHAWMHKARASGLFSDDRIHAWFAS